MKTKRSHKRVVRLAHADMIRTCVEIRKADGGDLPIDPERVIEEVEVDFAEVFCAIRDSQPWGVVWGRSRISHRRSLFVAAEHRGA